MYEWPNIDQFLNRTADLEQIEQWWQDDRGPRMLALYGRRRVGKSWLFRAFAHQKPSLVFVADAVATAPQLNRFAVVLERDLPVRPALSDLPDFFRVLFRMARNEKRLFVIDEFPYLMPTREKARLDLLREIAAVFEEEQDASQLKLIVCGSQIAMMESLMAEGSPWHGRMRDLPIAPLGFGDALVFLNGESAEDTILRYAIAGGIPRYLREFGSGDLKQQIISTLLDPRSALHDEPRTVLAQELREPQMHFSILEQLATREQRLEDITGGLQTQSSAITDYLERLRQMRVLGRKIPVTAPRESRTSHYRLRDPFFRFWFRFVFPAQADLADGLDPVGYYEGAIEDKIGEHVGPEFEEICRAWTRKHYATKAQRFDSWWGPASAKLQKDEGRSSEEIDVVGMSANTVKLVGECKWRSRLMDTDVLGDLDRFKLPSLAAEKNIKLAKDLEILLFSRSGFTDQLKRAAVARGNIRLVELDEIVAW